MFKRKQPTFYLERDNKKMLIFARAYSFTTQTNFNSQIPKRYLMCQAHTRVLQDPIFNTIHLCNERVTFQIYLRIWPSTTNCPVKSILQITHAIDKPICLDKVEILLSKQTQFTMKSKHQNKINS